MERIGLGSQGGSDLTRRPPKTTSRWQASLIPNCKRQRNHTVDGLCPLPGSTRRGGLRDPARSTLRHHFTSEFSSNATPNFADYRRTDISEPGFRSRWITHGMARCPSQGINKRRVCDAIQKEVPLRV